MYGSHHQQPQQNGCYDELDPFLKKVEIAAAGWPGQV
jgi:hypothetical protein